MHEGARERRDYASMESVLRCVLSMVDCYLIPLERFFRAHPAPPSKLPGPVPQWESTGHPGEPHLSGGWIGVSLVSAGWYSMMPRWAHAHALLERPLPLGEALHLPSPVGIRGATA